MPEFGGREALQPSLLDRLSDDEPGKTTESRDRRVISARQLREAVVRDLTWLLNTGPPDQTDDMLEDETTALRNYDQAARSVLNYGMRDLAGTTASSADPARIEQELRRAVELFEPRILPHTLQIRVVAEGGKMNTQALVYFIEGELWGQPFPQSLLLRTTLDLETGSVAVADESGR